MFSADEVGAGFAWFQLAFGLAVLFWGLRGNAYKGDQIAARLATRYFAPMGMYFFLSALFRLLQGRLSDTTLITLGLLGFGATAIWWFKVHRAFKAHTRALTKP